MSDSQSNDIQKLKVNEIIGSLQQFGFLDYGVFIAMLIICSLIGIYFGYQEIHDVNGKNNSKLKIFPVAMSLIATHLSGTLLLGTSAEVYLYGIDFAMIVISALLSCVFTFYIIIPIFHDLDIISSYEYLERRFDKRVRTLCSLTFVLSSLLCMPIIIYIPALTFNQVTGINVHVITPIVLMICIFYTYLGGIRAVIWTDAVQVAFMCVILIIIVLKGTLDVGGLGVVWDRNLESGRLQLPNFSVNPTVRHTFWTFAVGGTLCWINLNGYNQGLVQKYLGLKNISSARKALITYIIGISLILLVCCYNGLLIYASYHDCDPLQTKLSVEKDQLLPLFVVDTFKNFPGLPGFFVAGVFSAALSTISTGLNSMPVVILEDFFKSFSKRRLTETECSIIMKGSLLAIGLTAIALVYVVQHLGTILQLSISINASCLGPMLGIFLMGMFLPFIDSEGALVGGSISFIISGYLSFKTQSEIMLGNLMFKTKPLTTEGCTYEFTIWENQTMEYDFDADKTIYDLSYLYYSTFGALIAICSALMYCTIVGFQDPTKVNPKLLAPFLTKFIKSRYVEVEIRDVENEAMKLTVPS